MKIFVKLLLIIQLIVANPISAAILDPVAVYTRCYQQITGISLPTDHVYISGVKNGSIDPIVACMNVLRSAKLTANNQVNLQNPDATLVLQNFQRLHLSWFAEKDIPVIRAPGDSARAADLLDTTSPALYFTHALFANNVDYRQVVTSTEYLKPIRSNAPVTEGPASGQTADSFQLTSTFNFASTGKLLGIETVFPQQLTYIDANAVTTSFSIYYTKGGGFLGSDAYVMNNLGGDHLLRASVTRMPRRWGRTVYHDALCRELPVVRYEDAEPFVDNNSSIPFRQSNECVTCHVSMDRISAVMRDATYVYGPFGIFVKYEPVSEAAEASWPVDYDGAYYRRPPNGNLYYRNYRGNLVDITVSGVEELGQAIAQQDDYYLCSAKRYYQYFTGIEVDMGDLGDPSHRRLSERELYHRDIVINLGLQLKQHQKLETLVEDILSLPNYRNSDFGL